EGGVRRNKTILFFKILLLINIKKKKEFNSKPPQQEGAFKSIYLLVKYNIAGVPVYQLVSKH
ncbi:MAG: hypothetical protein KAT04_06770, partial [Methylococcales bacterium]|nr:hypothetical protein [Methylococcales bacterium]